MKNGEKSPVMIDVIRLSRAFDFASRIIQTHNEPNRVGEDHSTAHSTLLRLFVRQLGG